MSAFAVPQPTSLTLPNAILVVDDEPQASKWLARLFADEFSVLTANSVEEALALLAERGPEIAVVLTDYSMPGRNGIELLSVLQSAHPHISRLLISANADKAVVMAAINQGRVEHILEKPLNEPEARRVLRQALGNAHRRIKVRAQAVERAATLREALAFIAHEASTPLATVRGYLSAMKDRQVEEANGPHGLGAFPAPPKSSEFLSMIEAAQRGADFAQSLVAKFVQSAHSASAAGTLNPLMASDLVEAVRQEYPFDESEVAWVRCQIEADFELPGHRDLLFLVLCTLVKNALLALRSAPPADPHLLIELACHKFAPGLAATGQIRVNDNGPGICPEVLARLTHEPLSTRANDGGNGMGLIFCQCIMATLGGAMEVKSAVGQGAEVTLSFPLSPEI